MGAPPTSSLCQQGFTLVEVLVVLVLIGIVVSMVTISVGSVGDRESEQEARRLAALAGLASEEAVLKSQELGIRFRADGYEFYLLDNQNHWQPLQDDVLRVRKLPAGFTLRAWVDGLPVDPAYVEEEPKPHGFFLSSGERSAFQVELGPEYGVRWRLEVPVTGDLEVKGPIQPEVRR